MQITLSLLNLYSKQSEFAVFVDVLKTEIKLFIIVENNQQIVHITSHDYFMSNIVILIYS